MPELFPGVRYGGYETEGGASPKSVRRVLTELPYVARMVTCSVAGDISIKREDGSTDVVYCIAGHNPYRFTQLVADGGNIVKDIHF